ncbi:MAG: hypothetical protein ACYSSN_04005 [Planctomycetota bacterium]|jgi:hypothetical protein
MRVQNNTIPTLMSIMFLATLIIAPTEAFAGCYQPDAPDCPCFDDAGAWNPGGGSIQNVAIQTVDTNESCRVNNGGKPYYQMVLGRNSEADAIAASILLSLPFANWFFEEREAWCSEAISYWHREAHIPYWKGYRHCGWHCDWLNQNVAELKVWYLVEEIPFFGGRGNWMEPGDLEYDNYILGVTLPVPGAYVSWREYDDSTDTFDLDGGSHSLMINEMWIHELESTPGTAFKVEVTLLEGNSGNRVKNSRHWEDLRSLTPQGYEWIPNTDDKKIYGFGIDLDSSGQPDYDGSRLHIVKWPVATSSPTKNVAIKDPIWDQYYEPYIAPLQAYARLMQQAGDEPNVIPSTPALQLRGIPDGNQVKWLFPKGLPGSVEVVIDLLDIHPLPIKGMELSWSISALPGDYRIQFAIPGQPYQEAKVPEIPDPCQYPGQLPPDLSIPVPAVFASSGDGVQVRYAKLIFPSSFEKDAILEELRFRYYRGPLADTEVCSHRLLGDLDYNCRVDFRDVALMAGHWLIDCHLTPQNPACVPE